MTNPLDEGAIPSTSTHSSANWFYEEEFEVESYVYNNSQLILVKDNDKDTISRKESK